VERHWYVRRVGASFHIVHLHRSSDKSDIQSWARAQKAAAP